MRNLCSAGWSALKLTARNTDEADNGFASLITTDHSSMGDTIKKNALNGAFVFSRLYPFRVH